MTGNTRDWKRPAIARSNAEPVAVRSHASVLRSSRESVSLRRSRSPPSEGHCFRVNFQAYLNLAVLVSLGPLFCHAFVPSNGLYLPGGGFLSAKRRTQRAPALSLVETKSAPASTQNDLIPISSPPSHGFLFVNASHTKEGSGDNRENRREDGFAAPAARPESERANASSESSDNEEGSGGSTPDDDNARGEEDFSKSDNDQTARRLANTAKAAAFLARRGDKARSNNNASAKQTSVGARRVGSATNARRGRSSTTLLTDAVRKASSANTRPRKEDVSSSDSGAQTKAKTGAHWAKAPTAAARLTSSAIHATVSEMLDQACRASAIGLFGDYTQFSHNTMDPRPGTVLVRPAQPAYTQKRAVDRVTVRVASPGDDMEIANLRLSVFSDFSAEMRRSFCARSCQVLANRRMRGATCIAATVPSYGRPLLSSRTDVILGSAEVSTHEFEGTGLGRRRPQGSIIYVTEVAVSPSARRKGIAYKMLEAIDELAKIRGIETIYLHVDVTNFPALALYKRSGYRQVAATDAIYDEFTRSLNLHDGATKGRNHFLMQKDIDRATWLPDLGPHTSYKPSTGTIGFEVPV